MFLLHLYFEHSESLPHPLVPRTDSLSKELRPLAHTPNTTETTTTSTIRGIYTFSFISVLKAWGLKRNQAFALQRTCWPMSSGCLGH